MAVTGQELRELRRRAGLTLVDLQAKLGLSHSYLSRMERGKRNIDLHVAEQWAEACGAKLTIVETDANEAMSLVQHLPPNLRDRVIALARILPGLEDPHRATLDALLEFWSKQARTRR